MWRAGVGPRDGGWQRRVLDDKIAVEGLVAADMNGDGRLDLVAIAGRSNILARYEDTAR